MREEIPAPVRIRFLFTIRASDTAVNSSTGREGLGLLLTGSGILRSFINSSVGQEGLGETCRSPVLHGALLVPCGTREIREDISIPCSSWCPARAFLLYVSSLPLIVLAPLLKVEACLLCFYPCWLLLCFTPAALVSQLATSDKFGSRTEACLLAKSF